MPVGPKPLPLSTSLHQGPLAKRSKMKDPGQLLGKPASQDPLLWLQGIRASTHKASIPLKCSSTLGSHWTLRYLENRVKQGPGVNQQREQMVDRPPLQALLWFLAQSFSQTRLMSPHPDMWLLEIGKATFHLLVSFLVILLGLKNIMKVLIRNLLLC